MTALPLKPHDLQVCSEHTPWKDQWLVYEENTASDIAGAQTIGDLNGTDQLGTI